MSLSDFHEHLALIFGSSFATALLGHMVQTFPTPANKYGQWFIGCIQWFVGQRLRSANTMQGNDTITINTGTK
jgi:hypothetical protein